MFIHSDYYNALLMGGGGTFHALDEQKKMIDGSGILVKH
jgi:hypothetical protein